jgi:hypothetical protein
VKEHNKLRVSGNSVLRRILGPKRDEVTGEWRKLHNKELHNLYSSPNIIRQIKSRKMRWTVHVSRMGETRKLYRFLWERDHSEDRRVNGGMGSEWTLGKVAGGCRMDSVGLE